MSISKKSVSIPVHEKNPADSVELILDPEMTVEQRMGKKGLWSATVEWARSVACVLRERERGTIEADSDILERKYGTRRRRTGVTLRADAIEWARNELSEFYLKLRESGDLIEEAAVGVAGKLSWREALDIIRRRKLHHRGKRGNCSKSQIGKYERIMDTVAVVWPQDLLVEATSQSHVNQYHSARQGDHLEWERDSRGNVVKDSKGKGVLKRSVGRSGKPGRPVTPYAVIFPKHFGRQNLAPVDEVTCTSDLKDLLTLLNRLLKEMDGKGRPFLGVNPLIGKDLGNFDKRKLESATPDRYFRTMACANRAIEEMAAQYPHHEYVPGMLRCILALAFHTGHRISAICALRLSDILFSQVEIQRAIGQMRVKKGEEKPSRDWASYWEHGAIYWREATDKCDYDRVIPINGILLEELIRYLALRRAAGINTEWLFPRPLEKATHLLDFDARDMLYLAEGLARDAVRAEGGDPDEVIPDLEDRAFHAYRGLWENLRDDLGWFNNKNSAYAGGWSTKGGGSQQVNYNRLKPYYIQAVVDGKTVYEVLDASVETQRAKAAIQTAAPCDGGDVNIHRVA